MQGDRIYVAAMLLLVNTDWRKTRARGGLGRRHRARYLFGDRHSDVLYTRVSDA